MIRQILSLGFIGVLCMGAAPAKAPSQAAPAKPAAKAPAFDPRDPNTLVALLRDVDAKATVRHRDADSVFLDVTSPTEAFSAQLAGCNAQGKACQAVLFDQLGKVGAPTLAQINAFNQTSVMCRIYQDRAGKAHVEYSALIFPRNNRDEMLMHLNAWRGCLADFHDFAKDPNGFLAAAP